MVFETEESEALTVLGEDEPDNYDYESDEHTEVIERAQGQIIQKYFLLNIILFGTICNQLHI